MAYFTDNPLEKLMNQRPQQAKDKDRIKPPKKHPCMNCNYLKGNYCCVCFKDLLRR